MSLASTLEPLSSQVSLPSLNSDTSLTNKLKIIARERGFVVHEVPLDGNCLFSAVCYQLQGISVSSDMLRSMLFAYLRSNPVKYMGFVSAPVFSHDPSNADTEQPDELDLEIESLSQNRAELRWDRYLCRLQTNACGDNIAVQGLSDMFSLCIKVLKLSKDFNCTTF